MGTYGGKLIKYIRSNARQDDANQRMAINFFIGLPLFCPDEGRYNARWHLIIVLVMVILDVQYGWKCFYFLGGRHCTRPIDRLLLYETGPKNRPDTSF